MGMEDGGWNASSLPEDQWERGDGGFEPPLPMSRNRTASDADAPTAKVLSQ